MERTKIGVIGLGGRGLWLLESILNLNNEEVEVVAVCDLYEDRLKDGVELVKKIQGTDVFGTLNSDDIMNMDEVEAVCIFTSWESHIDLAIDAMKHGKYSGVEVGGAYTLRDCFRLVETYHETGVPTMMLENCCYGKTELSVLNMVREGLFGEIVHCAGGYCHELRDQVAGGIEQRHYRFRNYQSRNCDNYPTHELGPIAKVLNINRGNRMLSLASFASKARGLKSFVAANPGKYPAAEKVEFAQGDIVTTVITCADGATITLVLDTTLPRSYSRGFTVRGTKAAYFEDNDSIFIDEIHHGVDEWDWSPQWGNAKEYKEKYMSPLWKKYAEKAAKAGHDGMDFMVLSAFFEAVRKKAKPPIDVYDMAAWMAITPLSEESISKGGAVVAIPDFTGGKWAMYEKEESDLEFALD